MRAVAAVVPVYFANDEHVQLTEDTLLDLVDEPDVQLVIVEWHGGELLYQQDALARLVSVFERDRERRLRIVNARGVPFYELWNDGVRRAIAELGHDCHVAILNNDLRWVPGMLRELSVALTTHPLVGITYPDYEADEHAPTGELRATTGTYRVGGMSGFAFMLDAEVWRTVGGFDTKYHLWYGDDDFELRTRMAGWQVARVLGVPVTHLHSRTTNARPDLVALTGRDAQRFEQTLRAYGQPSS